MSSDLEILGLALLVVIERAVGHRFLDREDEGPDSSWVHADLDSVPYVIKQPEATGHVLPWYRRVFAPKTKPEEEPPPPMTYRG